MKFYRDIYRVRFSFSLYFIQKWNYSCRNYCYNKNSFTPNTFLSTSFFSLQSFAVAMLSRCCCQRCHCRCHATHSNHQFDTLYLYLLPIYISFLVFEIETHTQDKSLFCATTTTKMKNKIFVTINDIIDQNHFDKPD